MRHDCIRSPTRIDAIGPAITDTDGIITTARSDRFDEAGVLPIIGNAVWIKRIDSRSCCRNRLIARTNNGTCATTSNRDGIGSIVSTNGLYEAIICCDCIVAISGTDDTTTFSSNYNCVVAFSRCDRIKSLIEGKAIVINSPPSHKNAANPVIRDKGCSTNII